MTSAATTSRRALIFDIGGVVVDWNPRHLFDELLPEEAHRRRFLTEVCPPEWNAELDRGRRFAAAVAARAAAFPEWSALIYAYQHRWTDMLGGLIPGSEALLRDLAAVGTPLHAITNWSAETYPLTRARFPVLELFDDAVVISGEVGLTKPDPRIYQRALTRFDPARPTVRVHRRQPCQRRCSAESRHRRHPVHHRRCLAQASSDPSPPHGNLAGVLTAPPSALHAHRWHEDPVSHFSPYTTHVLDVRMNVEEVRMASTQQTAPVTRHRPATALRHARLATSMVFFVHAVLFASWTPHIPAIKTALGLSDASLGVALLGAPVGSVGAMLAAGALVSRWGSAAVMRITLLGFAVVPFSLGLADSPISLFAALAGWGMFYGSLDVAMNAQAGSVERWYGRSIFASFHACWSLGAFIGTGLGSVSVALGISLPWHMLGLGALIAAVTLPLTRWALPAHAEVTGESTTRGRRLARPTPVLIGLGLIAFCGLLCEGAAADWTAVYLRDALSVAGGLAGLGYAAFTGAMFIGRLTGDRLVGRFGPRNAVRAGTMLAGLGLAAGLILNRPTTAIGGFALLGVGLSLVVPSVLSASTRLPDTPPAPALALTTTFGWVGFLCGPPVIGLLASKLTLPVSLGLVAVLCLVMTVLAGIIPMPCSPHDDPG